MGQEIYILNTIINDILVDEPEGIYVFTSKRHLKDRIASLVNSDTEKIESVLSLNKYTLHSRKYNIVLDNNFKIDIEEQRPNKQRD